MSIDVSSVLCCLNSKSAKCIEITMAVIGLFGIAIKILGIICIPWGTVSSVMQALFIICFIFLIFLELLVLLIIYLRTNSYINKKQKGQIFFYIIILVLALLFLCLLFEILILFSTSSDLNDYNRRVKTYEVSDNTTKEQKLDEKFVTDSELAISIVIFILCTLIFITLIFLWVSEILRFKYGTSGSLDEYIKKKMKQNEASITDKPYYFQKSGLSVVGHDKIGNPIFGKSVGNRIVTKSKTMDVQIKNSHNNKGYFNYFDNNQKISELKVQKEKTKTPRNKQKFQVKNYNIEDFINNDKDSSKGNNFLILPYTIKNNKKDNFENGFSFNNASINSINPGY